MTTIADTFATCRSEGRAALMPYLTCGYPSIDAFVPLVERMAQSGADVIEVGFPHSDPLADGPVIQHASHLALERGFTVSKGFAAIQAAKLRVRQPLIVMCYANVVLRYGVDKFVIQCAASGVSGLIVPDMILEESGQVRDACKRSGVDFIPLVTLTTHPHRADEIARVGSGFVYFVSVTGTTGTRNKLSSDLRSQVKRMRRQTTLPVAVGFGIASAEMAAEVGAFSRGVIIGSKIIQLIDESGSDKNYSPVAQFLTEARMRLEAQR